MGYQILPTDPLWIFDSLEIEKQVAAFAKANGITGQAAWTAFVASISTLAQALSVCRGLLSAVKTPTP